MSNSIAGVEIFIRYLEYLGLQDAVLSPGSRNAPVLLSLANSSIACHLNQDERSAAFMALGMSISSGKPTVLSCTSGTALLNYIPGIMEAHYQEVPLIILTADRPPELIDQNDGQSINQIKSLENFCANQYTLPSQINNEDDLFKYYQFAKKVWEDGNKYNTPIHVNIPLREPLYNGKFKLPIGRLTESKKDTTKSWKLDEILAAKIQENTKVLILSGQRFPSKENIKIYDVVGEYLSNLNCAKNIIHPELIVQNKKNASDLEPDIVLTFGGPILSKHLKNWLRNISNLQHWHINSAGKAIDTFGKLSATLKVPDEHLNDCLEIIQSKSNKKYRSLWKEKELAIKSKIEDFNQKNTNEAFVAQTILNASAKNANIFFGNSMSVRYSQYVSSSRDDLKFYANRGISGIDGINSTALGIALNTEDQTILINGDVSFVHDINALWINPWPSNFKIVLINNSGGGIFRFIKGPEQNKSSLKYFEGENNVSIKDLCAAYKKAYSRIGSENIKSKLSELLKSDKQIIEIAFEKSHSIDDVKSMIKELIK